MKELDLERSELTALPESIGALEGLKELNLINNQLTALLESIGVLVGLGELKRNGNQLTALSDSIVALRALKVLGLDNNPLTKPQSLAVEAWLEALKDGGCIPYHTLPRAGTLGTRACNFR